MAVLEAQSEAALDGLLVVSGEGRILSFNRRFAEMWRLPEELLALRSDPAALDFASQLLAYPAQFSERVQYLYQHPSENSFDELLLKDGRIFERYSAPLRTADGEYLGRLWQFKDATDRKRAEAALRESETRHRALAENSPVGIWQTTPSGETVFINEAMCAVFEVDGPEAMRGKTYRDFYTAESIARVQEEHARRLRGEASQYEVEIIGQKGGRRHVVIAGAPLRNPEGEILSFIATITDISEVKKAQEQVSLLNQQLEQRVEQRTSQLQEMNRQLEAFCYTVAHDLRAPLRSISGFAEILAEDLGSSIPPESREQLSKITRSAQQMDALIQDLLSYCKIARANLYPEPIELKSLTERVLQMLSAEIARSGADVQVQLSPKKVHANETALEQVLLNLISNALKFCPPGKAPHVQIRSFVSGTALRVEVADDGVGIPPEYQPRIFNLFERLDTSRDGTGVGLAIVAEAVRRMNGSCGVESTPGQGSTFWFELPAAVT